MNFFIFNLNQLHRFVSWFFSAFTCNSFSVVSSTTAIPVILAISTFALISFRIAIVTIQALPVILSVSTFALSSFRNPFPIGLVVISSTFFHAVSCWIADVTTHTCPIILSVSTFALNTFLNHNFAVFAIPLHFKISLYYYKIGYFK